MTDPFLKKKWERVFYTFFDTNRNKVIDWGDFEVLFEKKLKKFAVLTVPNTVSLVMLCVSYGAVYCMSPKA